MPKHSASQRAPKELQARFDELAHLTDEFSEAYLNAEYAQLCREALATLARKRPSPLLAGKPRTWAAGVIHAVGMVNFLYDSSQSPTVPSRQIAEYFGLGASTMQAKSKQIRDMLGMYQMSPDWTLPSKLDDNPLVWFLSVNGLPMDMRYAPREIQREAYLKGLIPYIPGEPGEPGEPE